MSWAEEQDWFGLEDLAFEAEERVNEAKDLIEQGYWVQANLKKVPLKSMTIQHLQNCIRMIKEGRLNREWALPYLRFTLTKKLGEKLYGSSQQKQI